MLASPACEVDGSTHTPPLTPHVGCARGKADTRACERRDSAGYFDPLRSLNRGLMLPILAGVSGTGWIELRPCWARGMDRCAWEWAKAEFEGLWSSNSTGQGGVFTRNGWLL